MEQMMREAVHSRRNPIYAEAYAAMLRSYDFWKLYDHIEHSNMLGIFKRLYWDEDHSADTQVKLSIDLGVAERTLLRSNRTHKFHSVFDNFTVSLLYSQPQTLNHRLLPANVFLCIAAPARYRGSGSIEPKGLTVSRKAAFLQG